MTTDTPELARTRAALDAAEKDHSTALAQEEHAKDQHAEAREQYGAAPNDANGSAVREADHALSLAKVRSSATLARVERARADHQGAEEAQ
ncbi:MAG: hypothetical protein FJ104_10770, partial [Deltaproteobacteria bacterium]|nr:hypothetical protein [Deltaproteobacteria bacterium]